jgi:hypothetical protein
MGLAKSALVKNIEVVKVPGSPLSPAPEMRERCIEYAQLYINQSKTRRSAAQREADLAEAETMIRSANRLLSLFPKALAGVSKISVSKVTAKNLGAAAEEIKAAKIAADTRARRAEKARNRRMLQKDASALKKWLAGGDVPCPWSAQTASPQFRVKGDVIESTWGAEVPLADGVELIKWMAESRRLGKMWQPVDKPKVGSFVLNGIDAKGNAKIGCHEVSFAEATRVCRLWNPRIAKSLGL